MLATLVLAIYYGKKIKINIHIWFFISLCFPKTTVLVKNEIFFRKFILKFVPIMEEYLELTIKIVGEVTAPLD